MARRVSYKEGQWFAVPLRTGGYAPGIIARGGPKFKGGLGYFFPMRFDQPPLGQDVAQLNAAQAILITWFGDRGIKEGRWPLIVIDRPFNREDWPVPRFGRVDMFDHAWITEYSQDDDGRALYVTEKRASMTEISDLPEDGTASAGYVEVKLAMLIDALEQSMEEDQE